MASNHTNKKHLSWLTQLRLTIDQWSYGGSAQNSHNSQTLNNGGQRRKRRRKG